METAQIQEILAKRIALLYGGKDRDGAPILFFPSHGDFAEFPVGDVTKLLSYFALTADDAVQKHGFTCIVDMRSAHIRHLKCILKQIENVLMPRVKQVLVIKPESIMEKSRLNIDLMLDTYSFKIYLVSVHKLPRYVSLPDLLPGLGGTFSYSHDRWLGQRLSYEAFLKDGSAVLKQLEDTPSLSSDVANVDELLFERAKTAIMEGELLAARLKTEETIDGVTYRHATVELMARRVDTLRKQLKDRLHFVSEVHRTKPKEESVYHEYMHGADALSDWILGPGEKWLLTLHEVGDSKDEAMQLQREHAHLEAKSQEVLRQSRDLKALADNLLETGHSHSDDVVRKREYIDTLSKAFLNRVRRQREVADMGVAYFNIVDQFTLKLDEMVEYLCSEVTTDSTEMAERALENLDQRVDEMDRGFGDLTVESENFIEQLNVREQNSLGFEVTRDYLAGIVYVRRIMEDVRDRKQRCNELADVRRLKLQQMRQLHTSEKDADQAVRWIHELCHTLNTQHTKIGTSAEEVLGLRLEHATLEDTARSTYDYGRQLVQISLVTRRSLRYDVAPNHDLAQRLDDAWAKFCRGLSERSSRLNVSMAFYNTVRQVNQRLEEVVRQVEDTGGDSLAAGDRVSAAAVLDQQGTLGRLERMKKLLEDEVLELRHMGDSLLQRIEQPVYPYLIGAGDVGSDKEAAEEIQRRLKDIESRQKVLSTWKPPTAPEFDTTLDHLDHEELATRKGFARNVVHEIVIEHIPVPAPPPQVYEVSVLDETIINSLKTSVNWCHIQIDDMRPSMLEVGKNREEALRLQRLHEDLLQRLQAKQESIEELLSQADNLVTQQQKPESDVYEAMANSLGAAWKDLNRQLQMRTMLLEQAVQFFAWVDKHTLQMDEMERIIATQSSPRTGDHDRAVEHQDLKKRLQEGAMEVLGLGQVVLEKLRELGVMADNIERPRETANACSRIEDIMLRLDDRRRMIEDAWGQRREQLDMCLQASQILAELSQIEEWMHRTTEQLAQADYGDSQAAADYLMRDHQKLINEAKARQDHCNRLWQMTQQLAKSAGSVVDSDSLVRTAADVKRRIDQLLGQLDIRLELLEAAMGFFRSATSALARMDSIDAELRNLTAPKHSDVLIERHAALATQIQDASMSAIQQGRSLLQRIGAGKAGAGGIKFKVDELEQRASTLDALCNAHKAAQMAKSQRYKDLLNEFTALHTWLINVGESFLLSRRDMGTTLPAAHEFIDVHRRLSNDIAVKNSDVARLIAHIREVASDSDYYDLCEKTDLLQQRWERLRKATDFRVQLGLTYEQFHKLASEMATDIDNLDSMLRTDHAPQQQIEELWHALSSVFQQLKHQATKFMEDTRNVSEDPALDVKRARLCVETLLDHLRSRLEAVSRQWDEYKVRVLKEKEFREKWQRFVAECQQTLQWFSDIARGPMLTYANFDNPPLRVSEQQQQIVDELPQEGAKVNREFESRVHQAENIRGDTKGERDRLLDELIRAQRDIQSTLSEYQSITLLTVTFFGNLHKLDEKLRDMENRLSQERMPVTDIERLREVLQQQEVTKSAVGDFFRATQHEGEAIMQRARRSDRFPAEARREVEKIARLLSERQQRLDSAWSQHQLRMEEYMKEMDVLTRFEKEFREVTDQVDAIYQRLIMLREQSVASLHGAQASRVAYTELLREVELVDRRVLSFQQHVDGLLSTNPRGSADMRRKADDLVHRWRQVKENLDNFKGRLAVTNEFFTIIEEIEVWCKETTDIIVDIGQKTSVCQSADEASQLMKQVEARTKPKERAQEERMKRLESVAHTLYGDDADHRIYYVKKKYKEIVDSLHMINAELLTLSESLRSREIRQKEMIVPTTAPKFVQPLKDGQVLEGSRIELMCRVTGHPVPDIAWYKDGAPIINNPDYETSFFDGVCVLKIEETFTEDSAVFTCKAVNSAGTAETHSKLTVKESPLLHMQPPDFTRRLDNASAREGTWFEFECVCVGNPAPVVTWYKNEQCLDNTPAAAADYHISYNNGVCRLKIKQVNLDDDARFTCRASNPAGEAATSAKLSVTPKEGTEPPVFEKPLENAQVYAGDRFALECFVRGKPQPEITWRHNNRQLKETKDNIRISYDGYRATLVVNEAYPNNSGSYMVLARNRAGEASSSCSVAIRTRVAESDSEFHSDMELLKPRFVQELKNIVVPEGTQARLDCVIVGNPEPEVIWLKEHTPVKESPDFQLVFEGDRCLLIIRNAMLEDAGLYKCVARNSMGETTSFCKLTVTPKQKLQPVGVAPRFVQQLQYQAVTIGHRVMFECRVTGEPAPKVVWLKDGRELQQREGIQILADDAGVHRLIIQRATAADAGMYTCRATNTAGETKSSASLQVNPVPLVTAPPPPPVTTTKVVKEEYLDVESHTGMSPSATKPEFVKMFQDINAPLGVRVRIEGLLIGNPKPRVYWLFNNKPLPPDHCHVTNKGDTYSLIIDNLRMEHFGQYKLVAENIRGRAECTCNVNHLQAAVPPLADTALRQQITQHMVQQERKAPTPYATAASQHSEISKTVAVSRELPASVAPKQPLLPPKFTKTLVSIIVEEGDEVVFEGIVTGTPEPEVAWQKNAEPLKPSGDMRLVYKNGNVSLRIPRAQVSDSAKYTCAAKNLCGIATSSAQLVVRAKVTAPDFLQRLISKEVMEGEKLRWEVRISGEPKPKVRWFRQDQEVFNCPEVQLVDEGNGVHCLYIPEVMLADGGQFTVRAENDGGEARSTADLVVRAKGQPPGQYYHVTKVTQEKQEVGMEITGHQVNYLKRTT